MVLVLGVSAGATGARALLTHSDQPDMPPIDRCHIPRPMGAGVDEPVIMAIQKMRNAAARRGELISATAVACRSQSSAEAIRSAGWRLGGQQPTVVGESLAQMRYLRFAGRLPDDGTIVLYDLGSSGLTLTWADCATGAVRRTTRHTALCGDGFDTLMQWRLAKSDIVIDAETSRKHRELLSTAGVVTVRDRKSGQQCVFTANDLAELTDAGVNHSISWITQLVDVPDDVAGIVLLGGCGRSRLLAEQLTSMQELPVYPEPEPELVSARGAALLAVDRPGKIRMARQLTRRAVAVEPDPRGRRKLIAALAVTGALGVTIAGLAATDQPTSSTGGEGNSSPLQLGTLGDAPLR